MPNVTVSGSVSYETWSKIQALIKKGEYRNVNDFIKSIIEKELKQ